MDFTYRIIKDFWNIALGTWLLLLIIEFSRPGRVQRFINLEYWFYFLFFFYLVLLFIRHGKIS